MQTSVCEDSSAIHITLKYNTSVQNMNIFSRKKLSEKANENANISPWKEWRGEDQQNSDWTLIINIDFLWDKSARWDIFIFLEGLNFLECLTFTWGSKWCGNSIRKKSNEMFIDEKQKLNLLFKVRDHTSSPFPYHGKKLKSKI